MLDLFNNSAFFSQGVKNFTATEAYTLCKRGAILLDIRENYLRDFKQFDAYKVVRIPYSSLVTDYSMISKDDYIICADSVGLKSIEATMFLISKGFKNVANLPGGIVDWENEGLPVVLNVDERLSGSCMCQLKKRKKNND